MYRTEAPQGVLNTKGFYADFLTVRAVRAAADLPELGAYLSLEREEGSTVRLPDPGVVPADRWAGVAAYGTVLD